MNKLLYRCKENKEIFALLENIRKNIIGLIHFSPTFLKSLANKVFTIRVDFDQFEFGQVFWCNIRDHRLSRRYFPPCLLPNLASISEMLYGYFIKEDRILFTSEVITQTFKQRCSTLKSAKNNYLLYWKTYLCHWLYIDIRIEFRRCTGSFRLRAKGLICFW